MPVDSSADTDSVADLFPVYNSIQSAKAAAAAAANAAARPGPYGFSLFSPAHVAAATSASTAAESDEGKGKSKDKGSKGSKDGKGDKGDNTPIGVNNTYREPSRADLLERRIYELEGEVGALRKELRWLTGKLDQVLVLPPDVVQ